MNAAFLAGILAPVESGLERMRAIMHAQLVDSSPAVGDMTSHVGRFRGKQLRAALVLLTGEATGNTTDEHATVACVVEMIHLATLVHDDILDGADVRHRVACVNQRWDNQIAVLLGDFLYARAFALSTELSSRMCSRMLSDTTRTLCVGEIDQSTRRYDFDISQSEYERLCAAKTASLYGAACELGARYPGGNEEMGERMARFGRNLGLAFQIIDDCLDLAGTLETTGKTVGVDVEDGKVTLPVLHLYQNADEAQRSALRDVYTRPELAGKRLAALREACDLTPGLDYARTRAEGLVREGLEALRELPPSQARSSMEGLCGFVLERRF